MTEQLARAPEETVAFEPAKLREPGFWSRPETYLRPGVLFVFLLLWEGIVGLFSIPAYFLPAPSTVLSSLIGHLQTPTFWNNAGITLREIVIGYLIAVAIGLGVGALVSQSPLTERVILPYLVAFQTIPKVALAPILLVWFGFGIESKIVMVTLVAFFPILINVVEGLRSVESEKIEMLRSLGASRFQVFRKIRVPNAAPFIFAGLDLGIIFAVLGAVVAEFVGAQGGLGYQLLQYNYNFDVASMFAMLVVLSALGLTGHTIVRLFQRKFAFWAVGSSMPGA